MAKNTYEILAADIGGTSSRFARFTGSDPKSLSMHEVERLKTGRSGSFGELLEMLEQSDFPLSPGDADVFSLAIAGPVIGDKSYPPNISWDLDLGNAKEDYGFERFGLTNDFSAQAYACRSPAVHEAGTVLEGRTAEEAVVGVIGAGTGLGKAALIPDGRGGWAALPTEGGHELFAFVTREEFEYSEFVRKTLGRRDVIGDLVVSGTGLSMVHRFLTGEDLKPAEVASKFDDYPRTLELFSRFYARAAKNFALVTLPMGGLYIAGGVAAKNPALVQNEHFEREFRSSETHGELLSGIKVMLNSNEDSGLYGAAMLGIQILTKR